MLHFVFLMKKFNLENENILSFSWIINIIIFIITLIIKVFCYICDRAYLDVSLDGIDTVNSSWWVSVCHLYDHQTKTLCLRYPDLCTFILYVNVCHLIFILNFGKSLWKKNQSLIEIWNPTNSNFSREKFKNGEKNPVNI